MEGIEEFISEIPLNPPFSKGEAPAPPFDKGRQGGISGNPSQTSELSCNPSSIHDENMAVHKVRRLGGQENDWTEKVFQFAQTFHGDAA